MPFYEVKCSKCRYKAEELRSIAEGPRKECPKCGAQLNQVYDPPRLEISGYSPLHPRKLRGHGGRKYPNAKRDL